LRLRGDNAGYFFQGKGFRTKIGDATAITVDMARNGWNDPASGTLIKGARHYHGMAVNGFNPSEEKRKRTAAILGAATFKTVADAYVQWQRTRTRKNKLDANGKPVQGLKPRSLDEINRHLFTHCEPFHKLPVQAISRRQIAELLNKIEAGSGPVAANRVRSTVSGLLKYAIMEGYGGLEANQAQYTQERTEHSSDRCLTPSASTTNSGLSCAAHRRSG
jgi:hypothetical protein